MKSKDSLHFLPTEILVTIWPSGPGVESSWKNAKVISHYIILFFYSTIYLVCNIVHDGC